MALFQEQLTAASPSPSFTTVFNPAADSAVTTLFLCNIHTSAVTVNLYLKNGSGDPDDGNAIWKEISIAAKDTFVMNNERIILAAADNILGQASVADKVTVTGTYTTI